MLLNGAGAGFDIKQGILSLHVTNRPVAFQLPVSGSAIFFMGRWERQMWGVSDAWNTPNAVWHRDSHSRVHVKGGYTSCRFFGREKHVIIFQTYSA